MLEEEFKKESDGKTYLLLKKTKETFEEQMLRMAKPAGVLTMVRSEQNDTYKYEITGRKNLAMTFERVPMNAEQVEKVLYGILDILDAGREYLLLEENYILSPEHIYLRIPEYEVTLCYYPEYGIPFVKQLGKLFELLLNRVDYREEKAIAMVYALYMKLQEPDMTLEQIRETLREQGNAPVNPKVQYETGVERNVMEQKRVEQEAEEIGGKPYSQRMERIQMSPERKVSKKESLWEKLRKEVGTLLLAHENKRESTFAPVSVPCVRETAPEWGMQYTRVLSVNKPEVQTALVSQRSGETTFLTKFPFYVGSLSEYMDFVIAKDTVSRFHAKFIKQGERIFLIDLNSTNGTKVNGQGISVQEQVLLADGDRVMFADEEFTFREKGPEKDIF